MCFLELDSLGLCMSIALMAANPGDIWDYSLSSQDGKQPPPFDAIPIVAITTSAGTGSEVDIAAVISNDATKQRKRQASSSPPCFRPSPSSIRT